MDEYDPLETPNPEEWLGSDEGERILIVGDYHRRARTKLPNVRIHATIHTVVENQLAEPLPEVVAVLERLMEEGLDRHDAIHAIGSVLVKHMFSALQGDDTTDLNEAYLRDLKDLTAENWLASAE